MWPSSLGATPPGDGLVQAHGALTGAADPADPGRGKDRGQVRGDAAGTGDRDAGLPPGSQHLGRVVAVPGRQSGQLAGQPRRRGRGARIVLVDTGAGPEVARPRQRGQGVAGGEVDRCGRAGQRGG